MRLESGAVRDRGVRWIREKLSVGADDDWRCRRRDIELPQERFRFLIPLEIEPGERNCVAGGEIAQAMRILREARANDPKPLESLSEEKLAAHEERLEQRLA